MAESRLALSEYKGVWLFVLFDLPVLTPEDKRNYVHFRNHLLRDGFSMLQFSVYARYCPSEDASDVHRKRARTAIPPGGQVRILGITDKQFAKMENFLGRKRARTEEPPDQLLLL